MATPRNINTVSTLANIGLNSTTTTVDKVLMVSPIKSMTEVEKNEMVWNQLSDSGMMTFGDFPPVKHCTELNVHQKYPIVCFRRVREDCVSIYILQF